jgi:hypothetical protein
VKILFACLLQKDCNEKPDPQGHAQAFKTAIKPMIFKLFSHLFGSIKNNVLNLLQITTHPSVY